MKNALATAIFANEKRSVRGRPAVVGRLRGNADVSEAYSALFSAVISGNGTRERLEIKEFRRKGPEEWADGGAAAWAGTTPVLGGLRAKTRSSPDLWRLGGRSRPR